MNEDNIIPIGIDKWYEVSYYDIKSICNLYAFDKYVYDNIRSGQYPIKRKLKLINYSGNTSPWVFVDEQGALTILSYFQIACVIPIKEGNNK
jgi:hypothetical protein